MTHQREVWILAVGLVLAALAGSGCAQALSTDIKTGAVHAAFTLKGDSNSVAEAQAIFQVGNSLGSYIDLVGGDEVTCNGLPLQKSESLGMITYSRQLSYTVGATYEFVFTRPGEDPYKATVTLPAAVDVSSPSNGASVTRGQAFTASWTPSSASGDSMFLSFTRPNNEGFYQTQSPEAGAITVPGTYTQAATPGVSSSLKLRRERAGTNAPGLAGSIRATQERSLTLILN